MKFSISHGLANVKFGSSGKGNPVCALKRDSDFARVPQITGVSWGRSWVYLRLQYPPVEHLLSEWQCTRNAMSSYRKRTQPKPTTAAGLRAQASANGSSIFRNRPRSFAGFFGSNQNSYSSLLGLGQAASNSTYKPVSTPKSSFLKNKYSNSTVNLNYQNPYSTYGGTSSGYGGLTLPTSTHSSVGSLNLSSPSTSYGYFNSANKFIPSRSTVHRNGSFNRTKTKPTESSFSSRSSSLQSLASSEGYIVRELVNKRYKKNIAPKSALYLCFASGDKLNLKRNDALQEAY